MLLVMALTQHLPGWDESSEDPNLPDNVPPPFDDIARHCLRREAHARWSLADIAERLGFESAAEPAVAEPESRLSEAPARSVLGPQLAAPQRRAIPAPKNFPYKQHANTGAYVVAAVLMVIVGIFAGTRLFRSGAIDSQTDSTAQEEPTATARASSGIARVRDEGRSGGASSAANSRANLQPGGEKSGGLSGAREKTPQRRLTPGQVAEQTLPDVPQSARDTIRGTVRVGVRISVDTAGNVTAAELDSPGPSKYFAHLALEAAQQWKFEPPKIAGRNVLSDWLLHFQFTGQGTKVIPVQSDP
jgi:TonB family protein